MKKISYKTSLKYTYDAQHQGSHYLIKDSSKYRNNGELCESIVKHHRHIYTDINPSTSWVNGSDIESMKASVKSALSSLGKGIKGNDKHSMIEYYFNNVHSTLFIWVELDDKTKEVNEYHMNRKEFEKFVKLFIKLDKDSKGNNMLKFSRTTRKMLEWLNQ